MGGERLSNIDRTCRDQTTAESPVEASSTSAAPEDNFAPPRFRQRCARISRYNRAVSHRIFKSRRASAVEAVMNELYTQSPPRLGNQYLDDLFLRAYLHRVLPMEVLRDVEAQLENLGAAAGGDWYSAQLQDRLNEPRLIQWDAWGHRIDQVELTPLWQRLAPLAAE